MIAYSFLIVKVLFSNIQCRGYCALTQKEKVSIWDKSWPRRRDYHNLPTFMMAVPPWDFLYHRWRIVERYCSTIHNTILLAIPLQHYTVQYCLQYINSDNFFLASWSEDLTMFEIWSRNFHDTLRKRFLISDSCRLLYYVPKLHAMLYCIVLLHNMTCNIELNFWL